MTQDIYMGWLPNGNEIQSETTVNVTSAQAEAIKKMSSNGATTVTETTDDSLPHVYMQKEEPKKLFGIPVKWIVIALVVIVVIKIIKK